jgi:hypothetical protein
LWGGGSADAMPGTRYMASHPEVVEERKFCRMIDDTPRAEHFKLSTQGMYGKRGFNDRIVFSYPRVTILFEFKRDDPNPKKRKGPEKLQKYRHKCFKEMLIPCYVVYKANEAYRIFRREVRKAKEGIHS